MRRILFITALCTAIGFGCADDEPNDPNSGTAPKVRLLNMVYDGGNLDLKVDGELISAGTGFGESSGYHNCKAGQLDVSVHNAGEVSERASSKQSLTDGLYYTVYACPPNNAFAAAFQQDAMITSSDKARIKLVNATSDLDTFELRITGSRQTLLPPVSRTKVTPYSDLFIGSYRFSLKKPKDSTWSMEFDAVELQSQGAYTIVIHGTLAEGDAYPFGVRMFTDNGDGNTYIDLVEAPATSRILFVNAVNGSTPVDVAVDGTSAQVKSLGFGLPSPYSTYASGAHTYSAAMGATALISNQVINTQVAGAYTVFLSGSLVPQNVAGLFLPDETLPNGSAALVRFVNLVPDGPPIDVYIKDLTPGNDYKIPGINAVEFRQTSISTSNPGSAFLNFSPAGTYTLKFVNATTQEVVKEQGNIKFENGKIYSMWLGGGVSTNNVKAYLFTHQ